MELWDNFGFLKKINKTSYDCIHKAEQKIRIDIDESAGSFRDALESVINSLISENGIKLKDDEKALAKRITRLKKEGKLPDLDFRKKVKLIGAMSKVQDDAYEFMRKIGNSGSHVPEPNALRQGKIKLNYSNMLIALELFRDMTLRLYGIVDAGNFDSKRMYIEDYAVYKAEEMPDWDKSGCIWQFKACKIDEEGDVSQYAIIRQYDQKTQKALLLRNVKSYRDAAKMSDKTIPSGLTQLEELTTYDNDKPFYVIAYVFSEEPHKISAVIGDMDYAARMEVCFRIVECFRELHGYENPIYHRLLNPDSVYVVKKGEKYIPYVINFSYAKVNSSKMTVKAKIADARSSARSYGIYCKYLAPEYEEMVETDGDNDIWRNVDLYSLGVLVADILQGSFSAGALSYDDLCDKGVSENLAEIVTLMHSDDASDRPSLAEAIEVIEHERHFRD